MSCQNAEDVFQHCLKKVETTDLPKKTISCKHPEDVCEKCLKKVEISVWPKKGLKKVDISVCPKKGLKKVETIYFPKKCLEKVQTSTEEEDSNPTLRGIRDEKRNKILFDSALLGVVGLLSFYNAKFLFKNGVTLVKDIFKTLSDTPE